MKSISLKISNNTFSDLAMIQADWQKRTGKLFSLSMIAEAKLLRGISEDIRLPALKKNIEFNDKY